MALHHVRLSLTQQIRFKGHSKWQNIRHIKAANDMQRQRVFCKLTYKIGVAIRANSMQTDPRLNRDLERLLEECRTNNMPKATIQRAIERAVSKPVQTVYYDVKGPGGSMFIIEAMTDNREQTRNQLRKHFNKLGGFTFVDHGIRSFFDEKGSISVAVQGPVDQTQTKDGKKAEPAYTLNLEDALAVAMDVGSEDVEEAQDEDGQPVIKFICDVQRLQAVAKQLQERSFVVVSAENEFRSTRNVKVDESHKELLDAFFDTLNSIEAVSRVFDNTVD